MDLTMSTVRKITLKSSDGETFEVEESVALQSETIKTMIDDDSDDHVIPIPNVTGKILSKVIEYCKQHVETPNCEDWDSEFVKVDQATLFYLILAANFLGVTTLLDLICQTVADTIKGKTPDEIRNTFNIIKDFTDEEEEGVRRETQWNFI